MKRNGAIANSRTLSEREGRMFFFFILPGLILVTVFAYLPLWGWVYAFTDYKPGLQLSQCNFLGLENFTRLFSNPVLIRQFKSVMLNTVVMVALGQTSGLLSMGFAIFLNEMRSKTYRRVVQTITTLPHFISWVIVYAMMFSMFSTNGFVNNILVSTGLVAEPVNFLATPDGTWVKMYLIGLWKGLGWSAIVYLAAIAGIDQEQYEAAMLDGAGRLQRILHVTIPGLLPTYFVLLIMSLGNFFNTGMEQYFVFQNAMNKEYIQVLDLYVYNQGIGTGNVPNATAVGIMKSVVALAMFSGANALSKAVRGSSVF